MYRKEREKKQTTVRQNKSSLRVGTSGREEGKKKGYRRGNIMKLLCTHV
jgi:hypothetical protein